MDYIQWAAEKRAERMNKRFFGLVFGYLFPLIMASFGIELWTEVKHSAAFITLFGIALYLYVNRHKNLDN